MSTSDTSAATYNEETPLLETRTTSSNNARTPLPKSQIAIVLLLQICEPITSQSIYPYINALISELDITGGDERKVGYYAGLIESLFFATEALTVLQWSRASDRIGRKPVLLIGMLGLTISMLSFGLSRTFWALVISRCLTGLLNGNIGVMKSVMGELTDSTNRAEGFALMPVVWGFGATMGPLLGGSLSHPHERFPKYFAGSFWREYPYFLPCLVASSYVLFASTITLFWFKETITKQRSPQQGLESCNGSKSRSRDDPVPLRELLVYPIILSVSNYVVLAFLNIAVCALLPLFLAMPLEIGGLSYDPPAIGYIIGSYGAGSAIFQAFFFARIVRYFGEKRIFVASMSTFMPVFSLFPMINICALRFGQQSLAVWSLIAILLAMLAFLDMAYGTIFMYITTSSPNKRSLGATNGLSQTTVSIARAIGPALSTSLFSYSVEKNLLGGFETTLMDGINDIHDDERTPLLNEQRVSKQKRTPLPKLQIGIVLLLQICEPICSQSIYPYINELVSKLDITGGDERRIGYYAGLIESLFFLTEAITVFQWSRVSDRIGRKPVLVLGMMGTILSMLFFGLSRTFATLVISRCLCGLLNGNIGVMKSAMGELTDTTNRADAFALMPAVWALGATMGPLLGGTLTRPADHFPTLFTGQFWKEYPYFLPCAATSTFVLATLFITIFFFKETVPKWKEIEDKSRASSVESSQNGYKHDPHTQIAFRDLLTFPVVISIANYVTLAFLNISVNALLPLFFHMPIELGGLDLDPATIGYVMGLYGAGCIFMYVTESAPNRRSLGATNGLAQTTVSTARAIGPALSTSLFAFSVQHNILGGYGVYAIFALFASLAILLAVQLPQQLWNRNEDGTSTDQ
ncbi:hypothetical protein CVT25_001449 [Psilocybe cyanescens]|uniref:Major facilitator superfamily (MFS) profile domain-containing protein n=1 Tax=Psilocybe cyanescens TaxID=93625 RepID=A0A409WNS7_PSICY|nr:hypothetical protein CVT25_001449 [Psilocybe cyanescens]